MPSFAGLFGLEFQQAEECPGGHLSNFRAITGPYLRGQVGRAEELINSCYILLFSIPISAANWALAERCQILKTMLHSVKTCCP